MGGDANDIFIMLPKTLKHGKRVSRNSSAGMTPAKRLMDNRDWLIKHLTPLMEMGRKVNEHDKSLPVRPPTYDKGYWTALKLITVRYYMPGYLNILAPRMKVAYVDLFAGPGLNLIGDPPIPVPGSPLLPWAIEGTAHQFDSVILCEKKVEYADALENRVAEYDSSSAVLIYQGDANDLIIQLPLILKERSIRHSLVFIDPEGLDFWFSSLEELLDSVNCDVIINFPSMGITRNLNTPNPETALTVRRFLGMNETERLPQNEEAALEFYRSKLAALGKDVSTEIAVRAGDSQFHYHLIPAVKSTRGGSPWFRILQDAKRRIERLGGDAVRIIAAQIEGKQKSIDARFE